MNRRQRKSSSSGWRRHPSLSSVSVSSDNGEGESSEGTENTESDAESICRKQCHPIPKGVRHVHPFYGDQEDWTTWFLRFEELADGYRWSVNQRRRILLASLWEKPTKYAYQTLNQQTRTNYQALVKVKNKVPTHAHCKA